MSKPGGDGNMEVESCRNDDDVVRRMKGMSCAWSDRWSKWELI